METTAEETQVFEVVRDICVKAGAKAAPAPKAKPEAAKAKPEAGKDKPEAK